MELPVGNSTKQPVKKEELKKEPSSSESLYKSVGLSSREISVLELVATGVRNKDVADKLFVTEKTVKFHLTNIFKKLKLKSRNQLIFWKASHLDFK